MSKSVTMAKLEKQAQDACQDWFEEAEKEGGVAVLVRSRLNGCVESIVAQFMGMEFDRWDKAWKIRSGYDASKSPVYKAIEKMAQEAVNKWISDALADGIPSLTSTDRRRLGEEARKIFRDIISYKLKGVCESRADDMAKQIADSVELVKP